MWSPGGGAGLFARLGEHAYPAGGYFSVKKSNQKSLGEDPETPYASVRPDRKVCDLPDLGLDDAYKVFILIRFLLHPNQMRRRHLESVSSRSLSVRGSWGTAPSVFWYGAPGGTQGPLGKGGAAERWRVAYPIGIATRHGAKPATTHTSKRNASAASRTGFCTLQTPAPPKAPTNYPPPGRRTSRHPPVTPPRRQAR